MVGASYQGAGGHSVETHPQGGLSPGVEFLGEDKAGHRQTLFPGLKVLSESKGPAAGGAEFLQGRFQLVRALSQAEHQPGLDGHIGRTTPGPVEKFEGTVIDGPWSDLGIEALHRFQIMIEDVGAGIENGPQGGLIPPEIGDEDLDADPGSSDSQGADRLRKSPGAAIVQIVAGHGGHDDIIQGYLHGGLSDPVGFIGIRQRRLPLMHGTETAAAGAGVAKDQEGCRPPGKTFLTVGTAGLTADGMEAPIIQKGPHLIMDRCHWKSSPSGFPGEYLYLPNFFHHTLGNRIFPGNVPLF